MGLTVKFLGIRKTEFDQFSSFHQYKDKYSQTRSFLCMKKHDKLHLQERKYTTLAGTEQFYSYNRRGIANSIPELRNCQ